MSVLDQPWFLDTLERLAEGIVAVVGPHCEVVVHDFSDPERSVVLLVGEVTGRTVGAPVPDLSFICDGLDGETPDQLNYRARIGTHHLQSSTVWVRGADGTPVGAVCINVDYSDLLHARDLLDTLCTSSRNVSDLVVDDTFATDLDDLIDLSIAEFIRREGIRGIDAMGYEEKRLLVQSLDERGLFRIRGAVNRVAEALDLCRATVYNYRLGSSHEKES